MSDLQELAQNISAIRDEARHRWGERKPSEYDGRDAGGRRVFEQPTTLGWQDHLSQLIISKDPEQYLIDNPGNK